MKRFVLLGHDCAYNRYPAPVIPVGKRHRASKSLVAIYPGGATGPQIESLPKDCIFTPHSDLLSQRLAEFDAESDRLFAYTPHEVVFYNAQQENVFFREFLLCPSWLHCEPFVRLVLAKQTADPTLIGPELHACYEILLKSTPTTAAAWYQNELAALSRLDSQALASTAVWAPGPNSLFGAGARILIVEDQDDCREVLAETFTFYGYSVRVARDGAEAIREVETCWAQVVLLDLMLPVRSGFEVLHCIKANLTTRHVPVLCLSALSEQTHGQSARQMGANMYLTKPTELPDVRTAVRDLLAQSAAAAASEA